jgi:hypothetical protein
MATTIHAENDENFTSNPSRRDPLREGCLLGSSGGESSRSEGHSALQTAENTASRYFRLSQRQWFHRKRGFRTTLREGVGVDRKLVAVLLVCLFHTTLQQVRSYLSDLQLIFDAWGLAKDLLLPALLLPALVVSLPSIGDLFNQNSCSSRRKTSGAKTKGGKIRTHSFVPTQGAKSRFTKKKIQRIRDIHHNLQADMHGIHIHTSQRRQTASCHCVEPHCDK